CTFLLCFLPSPPIPLSSFPLVLADMTCQMLQCSSSHQGVRPGQADVRQLGRVRLYCWAEAASGLLPFGRHFFVGQTFDCLYHHHSRPRTHCLWTW
ncbi:hypothetical protein EDC04DRAFT_2803167, partial [Pisolithus marmoratus]